MRICAPCACVCVCVCVCAVNIIYSALLYGCDFLWHPQLSLHRITNFAVTFAEKLGSGDNIETGWGGGELSPMRAAENSRWNEGEGTSAVRRGMYHYVSISSGNVLNQDHTQSKCHIILEHLINMSLKDLQEELLYACKLREWGGLW